MNAINNRLFRSKRGFSLVETSVATTLTTLVLGLAIGGFMFALKNSNESDIQSELDIDVQISMERLKKDLRLSSLYEIFYYPAGSGPYTAISFPMAEDSDGDGLFELDADGKIIWDKTVVYHIWPSSPNQLRVTTFRNRDNTLSDTQRQTQLETVVATGYGTSTYNGANASTDVVFENLLDWEIRPEQGIFDAYSPTVEREPVSFGFIPLNTGAHTFKFEVVGKNDSASGYHVGIDQLTVSPSYSEREAEAQLPVAAQSGATATAEYMDSGSWKGNYQLLFPATGTSQSFTLNMDNDRWEETNFGAIGYLAENTEVAFDEGLSPKDYVVQLQGNDISWQAELQTDTLTPHSATNPALLGSCIAVHVNGSELLTNGNWIAYNGRKCRLTFQAGNTGNLKIDAALIGPTPTQEQVNFAVTPAYKPVFFSGAPFSPVIPPGSSITSDWVDLEINRTNNYLIVYQISGTVGNCHPAVWKNQRTTDPESFIYNTGTATNCIYGLSSVTVSYPAQGTYTSQIFDTRIDSPVYGDLSWNAEMPAGTVLTTKVRSGNLPDLSDASDWSALSASSINPQSITAGYKRYIQFQTQMTSSSDGLSTPKLKDITVDWTGEMQLVNISGVLTRGPDYGIIEVSADGIPLQSALSIDLMIYKDIFSMNKATKRVTSSLIAEIRPRNTGY